MRGPTVWMFGPTPEEHHASQSARRRSGSRSPRLAPVKSRKVIPVLTLRFRAAWARGNPLVSPFGDEGAKFARRAIDGYRRLRTELRSSPRALADDLMSALGQEERIRYRAHFLELAQIVMTTIHETPE
jgi:hypothetical protein